MYSNFILGAYFNYGLGGIKKDFKKALAYIEKSATLGHSGACFDMGKFYMEGRGVEKDLSKAKQYFEKAASEGNRRASEKLKEL